MSTLPETAAPGRTPYIGHVPLPRVGSRVDPAAPRALPTPHARGQHRWVAVLVDVVAAALALALIRVHPLSVVLAWPALVALAGGYADGPPWLRPDRTHAVPVAGVLLVGLGTAWSTVAGASGTRETLLVCLTTVSLTLVLRLGVEGGHALLATTSRGAVRVLVAGRRRDVDRILAELGRARRPVVVAGVCLPANADVTGLDMPATRGFGQLADAARRVSADAVIAVPGRHLDAERLRRVGWDLESHGTHLLLAPGVLGVSPGRTRMSGVGTVPLVHVRRAGGSGSHQLVKAAWERCAALVLLLLALPLLAVVALAIRLESPGPAFFQQQRIGRGGAPFPMYKLRTMHLHAEDQVALLQHSNNADGLLFKVRDDPRVTRLGRLLRRYSVDELPQLLNVVLGQMALVGPRPALPGEVARYDATTLRRLRVRPGLTGLWQVSGRSDLPWEEALRLDLAYVDNWSLGLDLTITFRTFAAVVSHRGAY